MKRFRPLLLLILLLSLPVLACAFGRAEPTATPAPTQTAVQVAAPANTEVPAATAVPTATAAPDLSANFAAYEDEFQGVTFSHPPDWVVENFFITIMASNQALMDAFFSGETPTLSDGAVMLFIAAAADELVQGDPEEMLADAVAEMDITDGTPDILEGPTLTTINGQEAITLVAQGMSEGQEVVVVFVMITNRELNRSVMVAGVTSPAAADRYVPLMQAVVRTVEVQEGEDLGNLFGPGADGAAIPIFLNETLRGEVTAAGPALYSFSGAPAVFYDIVVTPLDDSLDAVVDILDESGQSVLANGEVDGSLGEEAIRGWQPAEYGLFTISIRGFAGSTGAFELALSEGAGAAELTGPGSELETVTFTAPADGFYSLEVTGYDGEEGRYTITINGEAGVILELFDVTMVTAWLDDSGTTYYAIELTSGQTLVVAAQPEEGFDLVLELMDENDRRLLSVDDGNRGGMETLLYRATADGVYFINIRGFAGAAGGRFTLSVVVQ